VVVGKRRDVTSQDGRVRILEGVRILILMRMNYIGMVRPNNDDGVVGGRLGVIVVEVVSCHSCSTRTRGMIG